MEYAKENGKHTGIVVTSSLVHATPAAFVAHQPLRGFHEQIASQLVALDLDYLVGGGQMYFSNRYSDDRDLLEEMEDNGYTVSGYDRRSFAKFARRSDRKMVYFTAHSEPLPKMQGREDLAQIVTHALHTLSSRDNAGFFLLIEGSQIDYANHSNDYMYLLTELRDLEEAAKVVLAFARQHPDTLIVLTGDHESGSLAIRPSHLQKKVHVDFLSKNHSETMVPVFAMGPGAEAFSGIYENTEIFTKICAAAGFTGWMH
jgi:alkaline phosphatase